MWKGYHLSKEDILKGYLFHEKWFIKGQGVGLRQSLPIQTFVEYSHQVAEPYFACSILVCSSERLCVKSNIFMKNALRVARM